MTKMTRASARTRNSAIDPVCRMQVEIARAVAAIANAGVTYHFCSLKCAGDFASHPDLYLGTA